MKDEILAEVKDQEIKEVKKVPSRGDILVTLVNGQVIKFYVDTYDDSIDAEMKHNPILTLKQRNNIAA